MSDPIQLRLAHGPDIAEAGRVTVRAYSADGFLSPGDRYEARLADGADRVANAELWVAAEGAKVLGTVTYCPRGSRYRELARLDEAEFRMLAVDPDARGRGVGRFLVDKCLERAREDGFAAVVLCSLPRMTTAHRLYARAGFVRSPDRDWSPVDDVTLWAFRLQLGPATEELLSGN